MSELHERKTGKKNSGVKQSENERRAAQQRPRESEWRKAFTHYSTRLTAGEGKQFIPSVMHLCVFTSAYVSD